ncbi:YciI family protein [Pseudactinotalea sp. Z1739]|uniref:YciI family protein n=1 Tax=Pseudactinotalea sp. Z1739 TaxID=3413028 RepID=UPI003C7B2778
MRFLLLVHSPRGRWQGIPADGADGEMQRHIALIEDLDSQGRLLDCSPLAPPEEAVAVRVRHGVTLATGTPGEEVGYQDGVLAGYYLIECPTTDEAVQVAARIPDAATSEVLVHPLIDLEPVPTGPRTTRRN